MADGQGMAQGCLGSAWQEKKLNIFFSKAALQLLAFHFSFTFEFFVVVVGLF